MLDVTCILTAIYIVVLIIAQNSAHDSLCYTAFDRFEWRCSKRTSSRSVKLRTGATAPTFLMSAGEPTGSAIGDVIFVNDGLTGDQISFQLSDLAATTSRSFAGFAGSATAKTILIDLPRGS